MNRRALKTIVRGAYDIQKLRIQMGNRIVGNFKAKLGQEPGRPEAEMDAEGKRILNRLRERYKILTEGVVRFPTPANFVGDEIISDYTELCLVAQYHDLEKHEKQHFRRLGHILKEFPIWNSFLEGVKGVGPAMGGVIISEIDIFRARHPSSIWAYAGLDVAGDGAGRSRRKEHLVEREYTNKKGEPDTRVGITFNPFLKTKLVGVLGSSFLRTGKWRAVDDEEYDRTSDDLRRLNDKKDDQKEVLFDRSPYSIIYRDYKHRMENHARYGVNNDGTKDKNGHFITCKGRRHNMAIRYMIKQFLVDLYVEWRRLEGLPMSDEYAVAMLNRRHGEEAA